MDVGELQTPGQRIRWMRQARDMTQTRLGELATVTQESISQIERDVFTPRRTIRGLLAEALGSHPDFFWTPKDLAGRTRVSPHDATEDAA